MIRTKQLRCWHQLLPFLTSPKVSALQSRRTVPIQGHLKICGEMELKDPFDAKKFLKSVHSPLIILIFQEFSEVSSYVGKKADVKYPEWIFYFIFLINSSKISLFHSFILLCLMSQWDVLSWVLESVMPLKRWHFSGLTKMGIKQSIFFNHSQSIILCSPWEVATVQSLFSLFPSFFYHPCLCSYVATF